MELCKFVVCCNVYCKIIELNFKWRNLYFLLDFLELKNVNSELKLLYNIINFVYGIMKLCILYNSWFLYKN